MHITLRVGLLATVSILAACQEKNNVVTLQSTPIQIVINDLGSSFQETVSNFSLQQQVVGGSLESPNKVQINVEEATPMDDSIAVQRTLYQLAYQQQQWQIISKNVEQRCQAGRGSQQFSPELCH